MGLESRVARIVMERAPGGSLAGRLGKSHLHKDILYRPKRLQTLLKNFGQSNGILLRKRLGRAEHRVFLEDYGMKKQQTTWKH